MSDQILTGLEDVLAAEHEGWHVAHYVAVVGLERIDGSGYGRTIAVYYPAEQHDYVTMGLLSKAFLTVADQ